MLSSGTMRGLIIGILALVAATTSGVVGQEATFRSSTRIVPVVATVIDEQGRFVPGLDQDQFTILDNGVPQEITFFQNDVQPFTVVVMLDFSASMTANLDRLQAAAEQFVLRMIPEDKGQVGSFSDKIQFSGTFTNDRDDLIFALKDCNSGIRRACTTPSTRAWRCCEASSGARSFLYSQMATTPRVALAWVTCSIGRRRKR